MAPSYSAQAIGAALAVVSSVVSNLGVNIQKYSHNENELKTLEERVPYIWRQRWWVGLILIISGSIGDFAAFGFAPQALVAALGGGSTLVANVFLARFFNGEVIFLSDAIGVGFVTTGVVLVAAISKPDEPLGLEELEKKFARPGFVYYIALLLLSTIALLTTISGSTANRLKKYLLESTFTHKRHIKRLEKRIRLLEARLLMIERETSKRSPPENDEGYEDEDLDSLIKRELMEARQLAVHVARKSQEHVPYLYAAVAGVVGATSVLLAKISAMLIAKTVQGDNQFYHPLTYAFLFSMVGTILTQTHLLNQAMAMGDGMTVYPVFQAFWIGFSVIGGIIFYESARDFSTTDWALYPTSLVLVIVGILFLVRHSRAKRESSRQTRMLDGSDLLEGTVLRVAGEVRETRGDAYGQLRTLAAEEEQDLKKPLLVTED